MRETRFEWDVAKADANLRKHEIAFEAATRAFEDPLAIDRLDPSSVEGGEDRYILTGMAGRQLLTVVYTERDEVTRLISARKASRREHDDYFRQNSQE